MKLFRVLAMLLVVSLACFGSAFAEGDLVENEEIAEIEEAAALLEGNGSTVKHEHEFTITADEDKVITWPSATQKTGLIRFVCVNAGEYQTDEEAAADFREYVIYPTDHVFPADYKEAMKLRETDPDRVVEYVPADCKTEKDGSITIKCDHTEELKYDDVTFTGWKGACNETKTYTIPFAHVWGSEQNPKQYLDIKPATCTEHGIIQDYCLVCGKKGDTITTDMVEHALEEKVLVAATCTTKGEKAMVCKICGYIDEETRTEIDIDNKAHDFGDWLWEKEPTCTEKGIRYRLCKRCLTAKEVEEVDPYGHYRKRECEKRLVESKKPTCAETGYEKYEYICPRCNKVVEEYSEEVTLAIDPDAHPLEYVKKTDNHQDPGCETDGYDEYECNLCGKTWNVTIAHLEHLKKTVELVGTCAKEEQNELPTLTVEYCTRENCDGTPVTIPSKDKYAELNPEEKEVFGAKVTILKVTEGEVPAHDWTDWTIRNEYNQDGKDTPAYWIRQCNVCGLHDEIILNGELDPKDHPNGVHVPGEEVIENEKAVTCTEDGSYDKVIYCTICGEELKRETVKVEAKGHIPGEVVIENEVPATKEAAGSYEEVVYCTVCKEELSREKVTIERIKGGLELDDDGVWRYYVDGVFDDTMTGIVDYEGGSFFVADGVMCSDANGLAMYPQGTWYFLANGQIQKDYTGLALYDGEWFYIINGRLAKEAVGLVEFQGGQFLVSDGWIRYDVNGLWMDFDGTWYYLEKGQVAFWYTGVATYNGVKFNVVKGKLAF